MMLINLVGLALIALIAWWFWWPRARPGADAGTGVVDIIVADGVYTPEQVTVAAGQPLRLRFLRRDPSACAAQVVFAELGVSADLRVGRQTLVSLPPLAPGRYGFTCQMGMYRGQVVVR
ncbi:MAG: cupredoxin domain-containing protein [Gammaproteobacteria bacterium]